MENYKKVILIPKELEANNIRYSDIKKHPTGLKTLYINYGSSGMNSIYLQTPEMRIPFDNTFFPDQNGNGGKFNCKVSLNTENNEEMDIFVKKLHEFDKKVKEDAQNNCRSWFNKSSITEENVNERYTPNVRPYKDKLTGEVSDKFPPQFAFKVNQRNGIFTCKFYDENKNRINVDNSEEEDYQEASKLLGKGVTVRLLLRCGGLWFNSNGFGCSWIAEQIKMKIPESLDDYAFRDDNNDDDYVDEDEESTDEDDGDEEGDSEEEVIKVIKKSK